jgi:hypothetical protein
MSVHMASFGYELLAALQELLDEFDDGNGGTERMATITFEHYEALIARGASTSIRRFLDASSGHLSAETWI